MKKYPLRLLTERLAVCRLPAGSASPEWARPGELLVFVQTPDEVSLVCNEGLVPAEIQAERGWRALKVQGPLDFSLVGILADLSTTLAQAGVSLFAVSTFDTDYILLREHDLQKGLGALSRAGYAVLNFPE